MENTGKVPGKRHSKNFKDLTGQRFHRLTFLEFVEKTEGGNSRWKVRCDCGVEFVVTAANVKSGCTRSCGCYRIEQVRIRNQKRKRRHESTGKQVQKDSPHR